MSSNQQPRRHMRSSRRTSPIRLRSASQRGASLQNRAPQNSLQNSPAQAHPSPPSTAFYFERSQPPVPPPGFSSLSANERGTNLQRSGGVDLPPASRSLQTFISRHVVARGRPPFEGFLHAALAQSLPTHRPLSQVQTFSQPPASTNWVATLQPPTFHSARMAPPFATGQIPPSQPPVTATGRLPSAHDANAPAPTPQPPTMGVPRAIPLAEASQKTPAKLSCGVCCYDEDEAPLHKPCRHCDMVYCGDCIREMFVGTLRDASRTLPRCCGLLQLAEAITFLSEQEANDYRAKMEEYLSISRLYCPRLSCGKFIPDRFVSPPPKKTSPSKLFDLIRDKLPSIVQQLIRDHNSKFFRVPVDPKRDKLRNYHEIVKNPMDLLTIKSKVTQYQSLASFIGDFDLMIHNARLFNTLNHPVVRAGEALRAVLFRLLDNLSLEPPPASVVHTLTTCPTCFVSICMECKQIAHPGKDCDNTAHDYETALMTNYGYKRCPECGNGVRRMYGCPHMACLCGAHWCWYCTSTDCHGDCDADPGDDDSVMEDDGSNFSSSQVSDINCSDTNTHTGEQTAPAANRPNTNNSAFRQSLMQENLDAGGARRWADQAIDFGSEPEEEAPLVRLCKHSNLKRLSFFDVARTDKAAVEECNRCFARVGGWNQHIGKIEAATMSGEGNTRRTVWAGGVKGAQQAWECERCFLIVCDGCKQRMEG